MICRADTFHYKFAAVYGAELSLSNDSSSLVTWQVLMSRAFSFLTRDPSKLFGVLRLSKSPFKFNIEIKVSYMQEDFIFNAIYEIWLNTSLVNRSARAC